MRRKEKQRMKKIAASLLAASLCFSALPMAVGAAEGVAAQITAAIALAESDFASNSGTIRILLQQCVDQLGEEDPASGTLQSVILLLDAGSADAASVTALLKSVTAGGQESAEEPADGEVPASGDEAAETDSQSDSQTNTEPLADNGLQADAGAQEDSSQQTGADDSGDDSLQPDADVQEKDVQQTGSDAPADDSQPADADTHSGADQADADTHSGADQKDDFDVDSYVSEFGLPIYEVSSFIKSILQERVLLDVPGDWGNNAAAGRALISYSPVNDSGAISPAAGTLTISYFPMEGQNETEAFDTYEKNIADMSVTTAISSEDATAADLPARKIHFVMNVGANQFHCETVCFAYDQTVYAIELMQGQQTTFDYFPAYYQVVGSTEVGTAQQISEILEQLQQQTGESGQTASETEVPPESETQTVIDVQPDTDAETDIQDIQPDTGMQIDSQAQGDIGSFQYEINGHTYQFPTAVSALAPEDLQLNRQLTLPYDFSSDADMEGGSWTELVNTQYYYFENSLHKEMAGVTNMSGYPVMMSECMLTALIDTQGSYINITLPGGIHVGSPESDILKGFPEFAQMSMDGVAAFRGNELLYACNVRDDGCNGYVLIRNDAPFYSAVSIICENNVIKEISFECLGSVRADGVFL